MSFDSRSESLERLKPVLPVAKPHNGPGVGVGIGSSGGGSVGGIVVSGWTNGICGTV